MTCEKLREQILILRNPWPAHPERVFVIDVVSFDWNSPPHITPRYREEKIDTVIGALPDAISTVLDVIL